MGDNLAPLPKLIDKDKTPGGGAAAAATGAAGATAGATQPSLPALNKLPPKGPPGGGVKGAIDLKKELFRDKLEGSGPAPVSGEKGEKGSFEMVSVSADDDTHSAIGSGITSGDGNLNLPMSEEEKKELRKQKIKRWKEAFMRFRVNKVGKALEGGFYNVVMMIATVFALFFNDILLLGLPKSLDSAWGILTMICFCLFLFDLFASVLGKPGFFPSLFFFLDLLAAVSLLTDIPFLWEPFMSSVGADPSAVNASARQASIARAGRAARAGTRAGRLIRLFKLLALVKKKDEKGPQKDELEEPSVVGKKLAELTTRKVIIGVMLMVAVIPFLNADASDTTFYHTFAALDDVALNILSNAPNGTAQPLAPEQLTPFFNESLRIFVDQNNVLFLRIYGLQLIPEDTSVTYNYKDKYRTSEVVTAVTDSARIDTPVESKAINNVKSQSRQNALFNIILTIFIVLLLAVGAYLFSEDANKLMIGPIERMVKIVRRLAENPLAELDEPEQKKDDSNLETSMVEAALRKIGSLLQIGFGEAGAEIIGKNLGSGKSVNPMLPGTKCKGVFGFCDIRNFTDATECLQEEVMLFVNVIAEIVHMAVKRHGGSPNKNIGDAFLVVYKTLNEYDESSIGISAEDMKRETQLASGALQAFLDVMEEIVANEQLIRFSQYPSIQARMPNYKVKMGFGLHYGWAVEGAIGSSLKIDASYLSPHVNIAARLESATKAYGVPMLISGDLYAHLSKSYKYKCRKIDRVTLKGSKEPMDLYCVDLDPPVKSAEFPGLKRYLRLFETGMAAYTSGDWAAAGDVFQSCLRAWPKDEPAKNLLWYISRNNFRPPAGWAGFRELTEK